MAQLNEIVYTIANMRKGWSRSDDDSITDRQYAFIINYYRAVLIEQEAAKGKLMSGPIVQDLGKVTLIRADKHENCTIKDCILRTELKIPGTLDTIDADLITYVGTMDGKSSFQRTTYNRAIYDQFARYTSKEPKWYKLDGYIYIQNPPNDLFKYVNIQGIFQDPVTAHRFKTTDCTENNLCWTGYDFDYPISISMLHSLYALIRDNEMKFANILPQDTTNDSADN